MTREPAPPTEPADDGNAAPVPVRRAQLGPRTRLALVCLRILVLVLGAIVVYTFAAGMLKGS